MQEVLATCRILVAHGRIHIVIFSDPQPAIVLNNSLAMDLEVCQCVCWPVAIGGDSAPHISSVLGAMMQPCLEWRKGAGD